MRILVTGKYDPVYNRNHVLLRGLEDAGIEIIEFPYSRRERSIKNKIRKLSDTCDIIFLPSFTHLDVPFIRHLTEKPIFFDPLISRYLSKVFDYKAVWKYSPRALKNYLKDSRAFRNSDIILADTFSHKEYYVQRFGINPLKIGVVHVGAHTGDFFPQKISKKAGGKITIGFYGSFIPLHGIEKIIDAAKILESSNDFEFCIYGDGPGFTNARNRIESLGLKNTSLKGWLEYKDLNLAINEMDICLGIFGESLKAELVIPNKIYHYAACGKPIITANTKGAREIFENGKNIILVNNDSLSIAESIKSLASDPVVREMIAHNGFELIRKNYNEKMIAAEFLKIASGYLNKNGK